MKYGLKNEIIDDINKIFSNIETIKKVVIYGSRAKGNYKNGSDIDLTIIGESVTIKMLSLINEELENLYLPYSFDISDYSKIDNANLIEHIKNYGETFYIKK